MAWSASQLGDRVERETQLKIVSDRGKKDEEVWKQNGSENASRERRGVEIGCGTQHAYFPRSGGEPLFSSPTALGSVSFSGCWRDTKPYSPGSIHSNHIPLQLGLSSGSTKTTLRTPPPKNTRPGMLTHNCTQNRSMTCSRTGECAIDRQACWGTPSADI